LTKNKMFLHMMSCRN